MDQKQEQFRPIRPIDPPRGFYFSEGFSQERAVSFWLFCIVIGAVAGALVSLLT